MLIGVLVFLILYGYFIIRNIWISWKKTDLIEKNPDYKFVFAPDEEIILHKFWIWNFSKFHKRYRTQEPEEDEEEMRPWD